MLHDIVDHRIMCRFGVDLNEGEKLTGELRTSINDFSIPGHNMYLEKSCIRSLLFLICAFEICKGCSSRSNSQEAVNGNTICVGMVGYGWVGEVGWQGEHTNQNFRIRFAFAKSTIHNSTYTSVTSNYRVPCSSYLCLFCYPLSHLQEMFESDGIYKKL